MSATQGQVRRAIARAERAQSLSMEDIAALTAARGEDLERLLVVAGRLRDLGRGKLVTYSPKVFIPLTTLCRDRCHYCTFAQTPKQAERLFLSPDDVLAIAREGAAAGCTEALFTLGDRPEDRWPEARDWLDEHGYESTLAYLRAMSILVLEETGLVPHLNPGVMSWSDMRRLKPVSASMGMMLETMSRRLYETPGLPHFGSPDKDPAIRLRVLVDAGRLSIPFTTGILVGIGETADEIAESLVAIRDVHRQYGHIQEVIVQNFRAKHSTPMRSVPDLADSDYLAVVATARVVLGPRMRIQAPPNLSEPDTLANLLAAGVDDWGGVSPVTIDHVNPERPWPSIQTLRKINESAGFELAPRLAAQPEFVLAGDPWIDPLIAGHVDAVADPDSGLASSRRPQPRPWQVSDSDAGYVAFAQRHAGGRRELAVDIDIVGRLSDSRGDMDSVYGDWSSLPDRRDAVEPRRWDREVSKAFDLATNDPAALALPEYRDHAIALMSAESDVIERLALVADALRREVVGEDVTYVVNRNLNFTNVCYTGCRFCAFAQREGDLDAYTLSREDITQRVNEAAERGATEICMQGGIHPDLPGTAYFDLARTVKAAQPTIHLHAFSPMEVINGASKANMSIREWLIEAKEAGVDSIPGTAAEILDDDVRWILTKGKLPTEQWIDVITTAHDVGLRSSSTMMYGHVDQPHHWVDHLVTLRRIGERTGGFTEFVALPFVHHNAPVYLAGVARPGPTPRDNLAVHAMARLMLHGVIDNIQTSWVKLGRAGSQAMLQAGANDMGGTLMEETISRMAGSDHGSELTVPELVELAEQIGRPAVQRTTNYARYDPICP